MPTDIWSTPQDVEREPEIGGGELGLDLKPRQRQPHDPIVRNGEQAARPLCRRLPGLPWQILPQQRCDMQHLITEPSWRLAKSLGDILQPCHHIAFPVLGDRGFGGKMHPENRAQGQQRIRRERLTTRRGPRRAVLSNAALVHGRAINLRCDILDEAFAECPLGAQTKEPIGLANAGGDPRVERVLWAIFAHFGAVGHDAL
jgi:hypothetical protein